LKIGKNRLPPVALASYCFSHNRVGVSFENVTIGEQFPIWRNEKPGASCYQLIVLVVTENLHHCGLRLPNQAWDVSGKGGIANKGDDNNQNPPVCLPD
jgi:hypothetical protein